MLTALQEQRVLLGRLVLLGLLAHKGLDLPFLVHGTQATFFTNNMMLLLILVQVMLPKANTFQVLQIDLVLGRAGLLTGNFKHKKVIQVRLERLVRQALLVRLLLKQPLTVQQQLQALLL